MIYGLQSAILQQMRELTIKNLLSASLALAILIFEVYKAQKLLQKLVKLYCGRFYSTRHLRSLMFGDRHQTVIETKRLYFIRVLRHTCLTLQVDRTGQQRVTAVVRLKWSPLFKG